MGAACAGLGVSALLGSAVKYIGPVSPSQDIILSVINCYYSDTYQHLISYVASFGSPSPVLELGWEGRLQRISVLIDVSQISLPNY